MIRSRWARRTLSCLLAGLAAAAGWAGDLPNERQTVARLDGDTRYRLYLADPAMSHLIDGRLHVVDGRQMRYLSAMSTGFAGQWALSPDRRELYVATTYYSRLHRGTRSDVVEVYGTDDLALRHEIEIPPRHAQALNIRGTVQPSADGRWLLVQNATPASTVTVVDLAGRRVASEVPTPGCWGVIPWPHQPSRFSTVCGDGTLATVELDAQGQALPRTPGVRFFDPDADPVFIHYDWRGDTLYFITYGGEVRPLQAAVAGVQPLPTWSLLTEAERQAGWRPGGYELFAIDAEQSRLFVGMHRNAADGAHKTPAQQIWVLDLDGQRRLARWPGQNAIAMTLSGREQPRLFLLDAEKNGLVAFDARSLQGKPLARFDGVGETPVYLEAH